MHGAGRAYDRIFSACSRSMPTFPTHGRMLFLQNESYADKVQKVKQNTEKINSFWKVKRNSKEMDEIYSQLLRSGKGSVSRHYELTGALAEAESKNNPQYAHVQAILAVPDGQTPATKEAAASAGGAAPASGAVPVAAVPAGSKAAAAGAAAGKQAGQSQAAAVPAAQGATAVGAAPVAAVDAQPAQPVAWYWRVLGY